MRVCSRSCVDAAYHLRLVDPWTFFSGLSCPRRHRRKRSLLPLTMCIPVPPVTLARCAASSASLATPLLVSPSPCLCALASMAASGCALPCLRVHRPARGLTHLLLDAPLCLPTLARPPATCTCYSCATAAGCCYLAAATLLPSLVLAVAAAPRCCCFLLLPLLADAPSR